MKLRCTTLFAASLTLLSASPPPAPSDPVGVYAVLDRVVLKPDAEAATEAELTGAFAVAAGHFGDYYLAPRAGVLRYRLGADAGESRRQWRELAALADGKRVVAFGSRYEQFERGAPRVVAADDRAAAAVPFPSGMGLHAVDGVQYGAVRELLLLPRCRRGELRPPEERHRAPDLLVLTCANCAAAEPGLKYVFTVRTSDGDRFASGLVAAGDGTTTWTTPIAVAPGATVQWTVHVAGAGVERAPWDEAAFVVPPRAERPR